MKHTIAFSLGLALMGASITAAHAQRAPIDRSDRRTQRQQMMEGMTPEQRAQYFQNQRQQRSAARGNGQTTTNGSAPNGGAQGGGGQGTAGANGGRTRNRNGNGGGNATTSDADRETGMRALMTSAGITDKAQQDPIVAFVFAQVKARDPLLKNARDVATSLRDGKSTPDQISAKWTAYQTALTDDKARFEKDLSALDEKIG